MPFYLVLSQVNPTMPGREITKYNYVLQNGKFLHLFLTFPYLIAMIKAITTFIETTMLMALCYLMVSMLSHPGLIITYSFKNKLSTYYIKIQIHLTVLFCI